MAQLIVRNLDDDIVHELKLRAARNGRSAESEHREILRMSLVSKPRKSIKDILLAMPDVGEDVDFERAPDTGREVKL